MRQVLFIFNKEFNFGIAHTLQMDVLQTRLNKPFISNNLNVWEKLIKPFEKNQGNQ